MKAEERVRTYLQQMDIQRSKMFHAYAKFASYYSKLINKEELIEVMTEEDLQEMQRILKKTVKLIDDMERMSNR